MTALVALGPSDLRLDLKTAALSSRRYYYYKLVSSFQFPVLMKLSFREAQLQRQSLRGIATAAVGPQHGVPPPALVGCLLLLRLRPLLPANIRAQTSPAGLVVLGSRVGHHGSSWIRDLPYEAVTLIRIIDLEHTLKGPKLTAGRKPAVNLKEQD